MIRGLQRRAVVETHKVWPGGGTTVLPAKPVFRLGDLLLERGLIARDQLQTALAEQRRSGESLGRILVQMGLVGAAAMRDVLAEALEQESVDLSEAPPQAEALAMVPKWFAVRHGIVPILYDRESKRMVVAMTNPMNASVLDMLQARLEPGTTVHPKLAGDAEVAGAIDQYYGHELSVEGILRELETGEVDLSTLADPADQFSHPMVRLLNALLADAVKREASDIHIGPTLGFVRVRYRIDGVLRLIHSFHKHLLASLMVRIKVMGGMNIAETRIPQDGYISLEVTGKKVSFRVAIQPTINGENAVFRILDVRREVLSLGELGLTDHNLDELHRALQRNIGLVLVTGPTGSGKTTTLYSMVNHVNNVGINVMTLEDPVEYPMHTILQTNVNKAVGMDYAAGIKSLLWQDPDVILIGEVHDRETADMALQAAMTGHQVLATLHANSTLGAIPRLMNLGTNREFLIGTLNCIIAQRLVRRLCMVCRQRSRPTPEERRVLGFAAEEDAWVYRAVGCSECFESGYRGRLPVMEVLRVDNTFNDLIYVGAPRKDFMDHGKTLGLRTLAMDGVERVRDGLTTLEELIRVVDMAELYEKALEPDHG
ncbi:MAG: type II/IV secretion system protein [Magnetococcales bacterium]|nr:type II/IV secretion system protein [Magnetococcales bacterium]